MKKFTFAAIVAIAALATTFTSCGNGGSASLKNDVDTVSYAIGMAQGASVKDYLMQQGIDTAYIDEFVKGLKEGANAGDDKKKAAYYAGINIGQQISQQMVKGINYEIFGQDTTQTISVKNLLAGFIAGTTGKHQLMNAATIQNEAQLKMSALKAKFASKQYGEWKAKNEQWLAANKKKAGIKTLPSGVQYKVITEGTGEMPKDTSNVVVNYEGKTIDGVVFDSSYKRGEPITFRANQVIKGWTEALCHMPVGSTWEVYIPAELAYAERAQGSIKPFSTLIFKIELKEIKK